MIWMEQQLSKYPLHIQSHIKSGEETSPFWRSLIDMLVDLLQTSLSRILFRRLQGIHWDDPDWSPNFLLVCNPPPKEMQDSCEASLSALARVEGACKVIGEQQGLYISGKATKKMEWQGHIWPDASMPHYKASR